MTDTYKPNMNYLDSIAALLVLVIVPGSGFDEEADQAVNHIIEDTYIFAGDLDPREALSILNRHVKLHRSGGMSEAIVNNHVQRLPERLRYKTFSVFAHYMAKASDGEFTKEDYEYMFGFAEILRVPEARAKNIVEVASITFQKMI